MAWCSDPFIENLNKFGWNVVRMPRPDFHPLELLFWSSGDSVGLWGRLERFGPLMSVFSAGGVPAPPVVRDGPVPEFKVAYTGRIRAGLGVPLLGEWVGAMAGLTTGLGAGYGAARTLQFEVVDPRADRVALTDLDPFLADADINPLSRYGATLLERDRLYVVTETIKAAEFKVEAFDRAGGALQVEAAAIAQTVGGNVAVGRDGESTSRSVYRGTVPLVFGFKAVRLFYQQGRYTALKPVGGLELKAPDKVPDDGGEYLVGETTFAPFGGSERA